MMSADVLGLPRRRAPGLRLAVFAILAAGAVNAATALAQPPPASPDDFVAFAAGAAQYEMMAARLALVESKDARVRAFATTMLRDHAAALASLQDAARRSNLKPPPQSVGDGGTQWLAALQSLRGAEFDRAYGRQQVLAHRQAAANERAYLDKDADPNLRAVAKADLSMIEHHAQAARELAAAETGAMN